MLHWLSDKLVGMFNAVPALIVDEGSPTFFLVRAIYGLLLLAIVLYIIVMLRPVRSLIEHYRARRSKGFQDRGG
jgi:hypothetical protein